MRDADTLLFVMRCSAIRTAIVAVAAAMSACALGDAGSADEASVNERLALPPPPLIFDINGSWIDRFTTPIISESGGQISIDMTSQNRPPAHGHVVGLSTISVTFDDDGTFLGTLELPNIIHWSNGGAWQRVFTGPLAVELSGSFTDGRLVYSVSNTSGFIVMATPGSPTGQGFARSADQIEILFSNNTTFRATLLAPDRIRWSNGSQWQKIF